MREPKSGLIKIGENRAAPTGAALLRRLAGSIMVLTFVVAAGGSDARAGIAPQRTETVLPPEQAFGAGLSAYQSSRYRTAFRRWSSAARAGHTKAQASLGYLYFQGLGTHQSDQAALYWYSRASKGGEPSAYYFLGRIFLRNRGVSPDPRRALDWCERALAEGYMGALQCRDEAQARLSSPGASEPKGSAFRRGHPGTRTPATGGAAQPR